VVQNSVNYNLLYFNSNAGRARDSREKWVYVTPSPAKIKTEVPVRVFNTDSHNVIYAVTICPTAGKGLKLTIVVRNMLKNFEGMTRISPLKVYIFV